MQAAMFGVRKEIVGPHGEDSLDVKYYADKPTAPPCPISLWEKEEDGTYSAGMIELGPRDWAKLKRVIGNSKPIHVGG